MDIDVEHSGAAGASETAGAVVTETAAGGTGLSTDPAASSEPAQQDDTAYAPQSIAARGEQQALDAADGDRPEVQPVAQSSPAEPEISQPVRARDDSKQAQIRIAMDAASDVPAQGVKQQRTAAAPAPDHTKNAAAGPRKALITADGSASMQHGDDVAPEAPLDVCVH